LVVPMRHVHELAQLRTHGRIVFLFPTAHRCHVPLQSETSGGKTGPSRAGDAPIWGPAWAEW
jgi:hypothetical protein